MWQKGFWKFLNFKHGCNFYSKNCVHSTQLPGSIFSPSQKRQKLSHPFWLCFELGMGILNPPDKIIWFIYESSNEQGSREGVHISR
jgi:hypothetical protein